MVPPRGTILFPTNTLLKVYTLLSFWNSMTFHDLFHDLSEFSMTKVKQLFSKYCQNIILFKVFSHIMTHKMRASVYFYTGVNWFADLSVVFFNFLFFFSCSFSKVYCFSMTFHYPHFNSRMFQAWKMKLWNSMTFQVFHDLYETCCLLILQNIFFF